MGVNCDYSWKLRMYFVVNKCTTKSTELIISTAVTHITSYTSIVKFSVKVNVVLIYKFFLWYEDEDFDGHILLNEMK